MIISRTPLRISLVGGGTDVPAYYEKHPGAVLSFAINKYIYVIVNEKFDNRYRISYSKTENVDTVEQISHELIRECVLYSKLKEGLEIVTLADIPGSGTGLGSSSALTVGLLNCLQRLSLKNRGFVGGDPSPNWLAETAFSIEADVCHKPVGKQDHYASALGGFNILRFTKKQVRWTDVSCQWNSENPWNNVELQSHMLLLWTGIARSSTDILTKQKDNFSSGKTTEHGMDLAVLADKTYSELVLHGSFQRLGENILQGWEIKKKLAPWITNDWIDNWHSLAMQNGAWGGKLLGAGGGGFLLFIAPPDAHKKIVKATGLRRIDFEIEQEGSRIIWLKQ